MHLGYEVLVLDNLQNSKITAVERISTITGKKVNFVQGDLLERNLIANIFKKNNIEAVIHFAGLKSVNESVDDPFRYYNNNVCGTLVLLEEMNRANVKTFVFSSSATVYGDPQFLPYTENHPLNPKNPYGNTKLIIEKFLKDLVASDCEWKVAVLRYFNPVGAHISGLIGEDPLGEPNNLMPFIAQVAVGRRDKLLIYGADYDTPDGTGVRDYIHVEDLVSGHIKSLDYIKENSGLICLNLGTGTGSSVLQLVNTFQNVSGKKIPYVIVGRRAGDTSSNWAGTELAKSLLNWEAKLNLRRMCEDVWRWQIKNPFGYND
jgi:UDP-glucose 4-epimerase